MGTRYGQFCPVAMAAQVLCERWAPLVLRELMYGSSRFNDIARGVPRMSRGLLTARLRELEAAGVVTHAVDGYRLTAAGEALRPVIEQMGLWAQYWLKGGLADEELDDKLLMWSLRRSLRLPQALDRRVVVRFDFHGLPRGARVARRSWWLLAQRGGDVEICVRDPGYETDVAIVADLRAFTEVVLGRRTLAAALRERRVRLLGAPAMVRTVRGSLPLHGEAMQGMGLVR